MNEAGTTLSLREERLNPLLRRLDWTVLLPAAPSRRSGVCAAAEGALGEGLALLGDRVEPLAGCPANRLDLAVLRDPDPAMLRAARAALRPGGWCYAEWGHTTGGGRGARRMLEAAGFEAVAAYWPWPAPPRARFWLPFDDAPGAMRHFWATRRTASGPVGRAAGVARRAAWQAAARIGFPGPNCAIGRRPAVPPGDAAPADRSLAEALREGWSGWGLGPTPARVSCLLLTGGTRSISKPVVLAFAEPDPEPRLAVKFARTPEAVEGLEREATTLETIHARSRGAGSIPGIPRILFRDRRGGRPALGETALVGVPLQDRLAPDSARGLALQVTDRLIDLALRASAPGSRPDWRVRILGPALATFEADFGEALDRDGLALMRAALERAGPLPAVPEQRDCAPWNLLLGPDDGLILLDWESAEPDGVPALDLLYFLAYLSFTLDGVPFQEASPALRASYRRSLDAATATGAIRAECLAHYAARLGLDMAVLAGLAPLAWAIHARSDHRRLVADAGGGRPAAGRLRESVFLALWEGEQMRRA
jgi:hypothetical protein